MLELGKQQTTVVEHLANQSIDLQEEEEPPIKLHVEQQHKKRKRLAIGNGKSANSNKATRVLNHQGEPNVDDTSGDLVLSSSGSSIEKKSKFSNSNNFYDFNQQQIDNFQQIGHQQQQQHFVVKFERQAAVEGNEPAEQHENDSNENGSHQSENYFNNNNNSSSTNYQLEDDLGKFSAPASARQQAGSTGPEYNQLR